MKKNKEPVLVSSEWLSQHLNDANVKVIDGSWYMSSENRNAGVEYLSSHIAGAVYFDIDRISDTSNPLPHMFPNKDTFDTEVRKLGISNEDHVIAYDGGSMAAAGRVWWMFRAFGHKRVSVLDGGIRKWIAEGGSTEANGVKPSASHYSAEFNPALLRSLEDVLSIVDNDNEQILDARSTGRFKALEPEPREGMRSGHMPGAYNLPYHDLLAEDGTMKSTKELRDRFNLSGIDLKKPIVTSCGSGVSATVLLLALHLLNHESNALYDGSWTEWGSHPETPIIP